MCICVKCIHKENEIQSLNNKIAELDKEYKVLEESFKLHEEWRTEANTENHTHQRQLQEAVKVIEKLALRSAGVTVRWRGKINAGIPYPFEKMNKKFSSLYDSQCEAEKFLSINNQFRDATKMVKNCGNCGIGALGGNEETCSGCLVVLKIQTNWTPKKQEKE